MIIHTQSAIDAEIWKIFPAINVDRVKDIPADYPGPMGVPITFMDKFNPKLYEIIGMLCPKVGEKTLYRRIIIRHRSPDLPKFMELEELLHKYGAYPVEVSISNQFKEADKTQ